MIPEVLSVWKTRRYEKESSSFTFAAVQPDSTTLVDPPEYGCAGDGRRKVISPTRNQHISQGGGEGFRAYNVLATWATESLSYGMPE